MISVSILAFSSLFAQAQHPESHTQKVIVKNGEIITELGSEANSDTSKEISITIRASDAHDMPEGFDFDIQGLLGEELDELPEMLEMMRGHQGDFDIEIDRLHGDSEHEGWGGEYGEHGQRGEYGEHDGAWMFGRSNMGNNMPHMMDMGNMGQFMIMAQPMMMGQNRNPWGGNNRSNNDMVEEMHHRIDNLEEMVDEMHHRLDDLEGSLENIESMLHELLERR